MQAEYPAMYERRRSAIRYDGRLPQETHLLEHVEFRETVGARIEFSECVEFFSMPLA